MREPSAAATSRMRSPRAWRGCVFIATSLDGFIARDDSDIEWLTDPPAREGHAEEQPNGPGPKDYKGFSETVDHLVMGRGTYEKILTFDGWPFDSKQVIVLSRTLPAEGDNRVTIARSIVDVTALLDSRGASGVYIDGGQVIQAFLAEDLVDEITISRAPVLLGAGRPLFGSLGADIWLVHVGTRNLGSGMTSSLYHVVR